FWNRSGCWNRSALMAVLALAIAACAWLSPAVLTAADPLRESTALRYVPADASFFYSRLRMKQQYDALVNSKAWAKLMKTPAMQFLAQVTTSERPPELGG